MRYRKRGEPVEIIGPLEFDPATGRLGVSIAFGSGLHRRTLHFSMLDTNDARAIEEARERQRQEPVQFAGGADFWAYRDKVIRLNQNAPGGPTTDEEVVLFIKHVVLSHETSIQRIRREVEALQNLDRLPSAQRERIPDSVRLFVWQRDEGTCVRCGSRERLEFDHIIPVADGGSSTERNIQLLCENCNRSKGRRV